MKPDRPRRVAHETPDLPLTGSRLVVCDSCKKRGVVNNGLLKRGQKRIPKCVECR